MQCNAIFFLFLDNWDRCQFDAKTLTEIEETQIGWLFPKNSILKPLFEWFYRRNRENGVIQKLYDLHLKDKTNIQCSDDKPFNQIDIHTVALLFGLLAIGVVMAIMTFAMEKLLQMVRT